MMQSAVRLAFFRLLQESLRDSFLREVNAENPYFLPEQVRFALNAVRPWFEQRALAEVSNRYKIAERPKRVGIIMAGNVPMVGLHDLLAVLLTGHRAVVKMSHKDRKLMSAFIEGLPEEAARMVNVVHRITPFDIDFLIGTGSGTTERQLGYDFRSVRKLIRGNRFSVAVLTGDEQAEDFQGLLDDMLRFHGMGCRNVSNLIVPPDFNIHDFLEELEELECPSLHPEWTSLVNWERSILEMRNAPCVATSSLVFEQREAISPARPGVIHVVSASSNLVEHMLEGARSQIQVVTGRGYLPFGRAQHPGLLDFADNVDTFDLLSKLS